MKRALLLAVLALAACGSDPEPAADRAPVEVEASTADSLFLAAHKRLREGSPAAAGRLFETVRSGVDETLAAEATYWEAFARSRVGDPASLARARELLATLVLEHPDSPLSADAVELELRILGRLAGLETGEPGRTLDADSFLAACDAGDPYAPVLALSGLVRSDPERGMEALERALTGGTCPPDARHNALYVVPLASGEAGAALLERVARADPDPSVRLDAAIALQRFADRGGLDRLLGLWEPVESRAMKEQLMLQYAALDDPAGDAKLREIAEDDPDQWVRNFARVALLARRTTLIDRLLPL